MERIRPRSRTWSRRRFAACARLAACLYELRVIVAFGGLALGPLTSRFAHDVVLLLAAVGAVLAQRAQRAAGSGSPGC